MDYEKFFREGLLFSASDAGKLGAFLSKACVALGIALGAGVATAVGKDVARTGGEGEYGPIAIAAGFVVGAAAGTVACMRVKSKIVTFLEQFSDADQANAALVPAVRASLRAEAEALLRMAAPEQLSDEGLVA
jgi:hypothetical protein